MRYVTLTEARELLANYCVDEPPTGALARLAGWDIRRYPKQQTSNHDVRIGDRWVPQDTVALVIYAEGDRFLRLPEWRSATC